MVPKGSHQQRNGAGLTEPTRLALKIDVDTHAGLKDGVVALLDILRRRNLPASFFVPFGPDNSGRALFRVFRHKGFLAKMRRTRALSIYGLKTALSGTLLPGRAIGPSFPDRLEMIQKAGHELGLHGYDHVFWHDRLLSLDSKRVRDEFMKGYDAFRRVVGYPPKASAAPGWQCSAESLEVQETVPLLYHSDTRSDEPYFPRVGERAFKTLEIPTTLPTWDEACRFPDLKAGRLNVFTLHAEIEGGPQQKPFGMFLDLCLAQGVQFVKLADEASKLLSNPSQISSWEIIQGRLPGRAGTVTRACVAGGELV